MSIQRPSYALQWTVAEHRSCNPGVAAAEFEIVRQK
jgi:hypothetical protein